MLKASVLYRCELIHVQRLRQGLEQLRSGHTFDLVLLDLTLPDSDGLASLDAIIQRESRLPIVVLTHLNDDEVAVEAVRHGAQDYLVKRSVNQDSLIRSIRYSVERKQAAEALRQANEILEQRVQQRTIELETANRRLKLAQLAARIGSFEWCLPSGPMTWTSELEALYGLDPGSFSGKLSEWIQYVESSDQERILSSFQAFTTADFRGSQEFSQEFRIITTAGEERWILAKGQVFSKIEPSSLTLIGVQIDITDKKLLEAQFLHAQRLESLGTLSSGIAHDLNNILTPVLAVSQLLPQQPNLNETSRRLLTLLGKSARRGVDLVQQILTFARSEQQEQSVSVNPGEIVREVAQIVRQTLPKSIKIVQELPEKLWPIMADETQLHQVFVNLCVNARDAMEQGGVLTLRGENIAQLETLEAHYAAAKPGPYVLISICDTGSGIAPEVRDRIFDPFFTTKSVGKGTGLGLSAVQGIIKRHNGFVDVSSEVGRGSCFKVFLPAVPQQNPQALSQPPCFPTALDPEQGLILVVDDEAAIREVAKATLEMHHYQVITAEDGQAALSLVEQRGQEIQGVLMDIMMPELDGYETIRRIHQQQPALFAVAMTGLCDADSIAKARCYGFRTMISKPFTTDQLLQSFQPLRSSLSL